MERKDCHTSIYDSNVYRVAEELKMQERKVIDFSCPANPLGVSKKVKAEIRKHLKYLHRQPDPEAKRLRKRLAQYHGIDSEMILCGNGSTELVHLIVRVLKPRRVFMPALTISEFQRTCEKNAGCQVSRFRLSRKNYFDVDASEIMEALDDCRSEEQENLNAPQLTPDVQQPIDMVFLCNPNNVTGRVLKREDVKKIADFTKGLPCYLIVDEAFIDFCPDESVIGDVLENPFLIVLRSMSFFYALAGLRIGYGVFSPEVVEKFRSCKEPWSPNSLAQRAAVTALNDKAYKKETFMLLQQEKKIFEKSFKRLGIEFIPSNANFYLIRIKNALEIARELRREGILVMECMNSDGQECSYLRIAVKSHRENVLLTKHLTAILRDRG
jgi:threonine-phosphate decarboxylase